MRILFFHRLDLVHLYGPVSKILSKHHSVIHVAYSEEEESILADQYGIANDVINLSDSRANLYNQTELNQSKLEHLDKFIIDATDGRFNFNASLQYDRTYSLISYDQACRLSLFYFEFWDSLFKETKPDVVFHEPPAIFMTHVLSMICKMNKAIYLTQIHVIGRNRFQWIFLEGDSATPIEIKLTEKTNSVKVTKEEVHNFLQEFRSDHKVLLADEIKTETSATNFKGLRLLKGILSSIFAEIKFNRYITQKEGRPINHINDFLQLNNPNLFIRLENLYNRLYKNYFDEPNPSERYFFYPLHLEPEAVVLYYADGWYKGQIKLIENIAAQLPAGCLLYIKDHPHGGNYRNMRDYEVLKKIPNLKIIPSHVPGKKLISDSIGVITINGTAGFEALLMKKPVFCFGHSFYSGFEGVSFIPHIKDLRAMIENGLKYTYDETKIINQVSAFLTSSHPGFVGFFAGRQNKVDIAMEENIQLIAKAINDFLSSTTKDDEQFV